MRVREAVKGRGRKWRKNDTGYKTLVPPTLRRKSLLSIVQFSLQTTPNVRLRLNFS